MDKAASCSCGGGGGGRGSSSPVVELPPELLQRTASLLPPNDLALGWRLTCKEAARRFNEPHQRTVHMSRPLPGHAATSPLCMAAAESALRQLTFRRKLLVLSTAACSGCEANVGFAWRLLQPHVFPELLRTDHYGELLRREPPVVVSMQLGAGAGDGTGTCSAEFDRYKVTDVGSAAVASGLSHMLPFLEQRCPGLLNPGATLEAAAHHCDLQGLQAAWELVKERPPSSLTAHIPSQPGAFVFPHITCQKQLQELWWRVMAAAACSSTPDAIAKMAWVLGTKPRADVKLIGPEENLCGAAAASGDMSRVRWLRERGFPWCTGEVLQAVVHHADLSIIQQLEQEGGCLPPPPGHGGSSSSSSSSIKDAVFTAAGASRDAVGKLRWLADRYGAALVQADAVEDAAWLGNLEPVQFLLEHCRGQGASPEGAAPADGAGGEAAALPAAALGYAVGSGSVPTASWLHHAAGYPLHAMFYLAACANGDLPMVRWLLDAGCRRHWLGLGNIVHVWPSGVAADGERLVEAVRLLAAAGWPAKGRACDHPLLMAARGGQPWSVLCMLRELLPLEYREIGIETAREAAATGCEAALEGLVGLGVCKAYGVNLQVTWYAVAARNGDLGALSCLRRLGVPLRERVVAAAVSVGVPVPSLRWLLDQGATWSSLEEREALEGLRTMPAYGGVHRHQAAGEVRAWLQGLMLGGAVAT